MRMQTSRNLVREPSRCAPNRRAKVIDIGVEYQAPDRRRGRWAALAALVVVAAVIALVLVVLG